MLTSQLHQGILVTLIIFTWKCWIQESTLVMQDWECENIHQTHS
jgi:hypothetical protein